MALAIEYAWRHGHLTPSFFPVLPSGLNVRDFALALHSLYKLEDTETVQVRSGVPPHRKLPGTLMLRPGDAVEVRRKYVSPDKGAVVPVPPLGPWVRTETPVVAAAAHAAAAATESGSAPFLCTVAFAVHGGSDPGLYGTLEVARAAASAGGAAPPRRVCLRESVADAVDIIASAVGATAAWACLWNTHPTVFLIHVVPLAHLADSLPPSCRLHTDYLPWLHADMQVPRRSGAPWGKWLPSVDPRVIRLRRACTLKDRVQLRARARAQPRLRAAALNESETPKAK